MPNAPTPRKGIGRIISTTLTVIATRPGQDLDHGVIWPEIEKVAQQEPGYRRDYELHLLKGETPPCPKRNARIWGTSSIL
jgi:hypothetical protein